MYVCVRGGYVCMCRANVCTHTKTNNLAFPKKYFFGPKYFFYPNGDVGKSLFVAFFCHILFLGVSMTVPFPIGGLRGMGYKSLGHAPPRVRAGPKFLLQGNSSVSAQYLQNFGAVGHSFLFPYALHTDIFFWFGCLFE